MTAPGGDIDGGTPESADAASVPTLDEFRKFVGAAEDGSDDERATDDLEEAVSMVDLFCKDAHTVIPDKTRKKWYLVVGAELFDATQAPSAGARFENDTPVTRTSRDPMHSIMRQVRRYVSPF